MSNHSVDFETILTNSAARLSRVAQAPQHLPAYKRRRYRLADIGMFVGISMFASVVFVAAFTPVSVEVSRVRSDALIALIVAQCVIAAAASYKAGYRPLSTHTGKLQTRRTRARSGSGRRKATDVDQPRRLPTIAFSSGILGGKVYVAFSDGSVEIDTLLGRRRFFDMDSARDFVGD
jgi:hypothetical protein